MASPGPEPTLAKIADALATHEAADGTLQAGVAVQLRNERGWDGRLVDLLEVLAEDDQSSATASSTGSSTVPTGLPRRIQGQLAGGWRSDRLALTAHDEVILRGVHQVLAADDPAQASRPEGGSADTVTRSG